jgi:hypothetical protein
MDKIPLKVQGKGRQTMEEEEKEKDRKGGNIFLIFATIATTKQFNGHWHQELWIFESS